MLLKRLYDHDAPKKEWVVREETCETCNGRGKVVNEALDGISDCMDCDGGIRKRKIPPVSGIQVLRAGPVQHFSTRLVEGGQEEGWLSLDGDHLTIHGVDGLVIYRVNRRPGRYGDERIHYYDCEKVE